MVVGPDLTHNGESDAFVTKLQSTHKISGVLDAAGFRGLISPGSVVSVFGFFAEQTAVADTVPLSLNLNGFSVTFNDKEGAPFGAFAGAFDQANVQVPWDLDVSAGPVDVRVHWKDPDKEVWSVPFSVDAALASPGIFTFDFGPGRAIVQNLDGSFAHPAGSLGATPAAPALIGGVIIIWSNGLGPVPTPPATGDAPGFDAGGLPILLAPTKKVRVFIGGQLAQSFPVLHPTLVGVNQVNAVIPAGVTPGDTVSIVIEVDCGGGNIFRSRDDVTIAVGPVP